MHLTVFLNAKVKTTKRSQYVEAALMDIDRTSLSRNKDR